jgi:hypothetical protein
MIGSRPPGRGPRDRPRGGIIISRATVNRVARHRGVILSTDGRLLEARADGGGLAIVSKLDEVRAWRQDQFQRPQRCVWRSVVR